MVLTDKENKAIDQKFENPNRVIKCPRCGALLEYKKYQTASQVKCQTEGCIQVSLRGI